MISTLAQPLDPEPHAVCDAQRLGIFLLVALTGWLSLPCRAETNDVLGTWIASQASLKSWTAECLQTRSLKTLTTPLVSTGRVWFAASDRFRWELGQPAQTIAVRRGADLWIAYPRLKTVEHYDLGSKSVGPWRDALSLLEAGFPKDRAQVDRQYRVAGLVATNGVSEVTLRPNSNAARRFIAEVRVAVGTGDGSLRATELVFADGSRMRNDFREPQRNPVVEEARFEPPIEPGFLVTEPLKP